MDRRFDVCLPGQEGLFANARTLQSDGADHVPFTAALLHHAFLPQSRNVGSWDWRKAYLFQRREKSSPGSRTVRSPPYRENEKKVIWLLFWLTPLNTSAGRSMSAWDVRTFKKVSRADFSGAPSQFTIVKDKVIVGSTLGGPIPILVWDLRSNEANVFGSFSGLYLWHVDAEDILVTFEINWESHPPKVQQSKWRLTDGELLQRSHFRLSLGGRRLRKKGILRHSNDWIRSYGDTTVTQLYSDSYPDATIHLMYDYAFDLLSLQWIDCDQPINDLTRWGGGGFLCPHITFRWAHQLRGLAVHNAATGTTTVHPYQLDTREVSARNSLGAGLRPSSSSMKSTDFMPSTLQCFGDQEVCGIVKGDGMQLWFFNPEFVPDVPDAEPFLAMEESG